MRFSSLLLLLCLLLSCAAQAGEESARELGKQVRNQLNALDDQKIERPAWLDPARAKPLNWEPTRPTVESMTQQSVIPTQDRPIKRAGQGDGLYVLVSFGMPPQVLRSYLDQAADHTGQVVFVVRGIQSGKIPDVAQAFADVAGHFRFKVQIDPAPFREHEVESVPVFLGKDPQGVWRRIDGEVSLSGAAERIAAGVDEKVLGPLHPVTEPDMMDIIAERIANADWDQMKADAISRMETKALKTDVIDPPVAQTDEDYWVDMSIRLTRDINLPDGRLVAAAGSRINPLDEIQLSKRYIVFDATDERQRAVVSDWLAESTAATLITTRMPTERLEREQVGEELGDHVFLANQFLLHRLDIRAVPALVQQDGDKLRVSLRAVSDPRGQDKDD